MEAETETEELPVWVNGTQKWVTGLTRRTTCDDAIYALLYNERLHESGRAHSYLIFERWRDVERPLQGRTKILKIWRAWGAEQCNVTLTMRRASDEHVECNELCRSKKKYRKSRQKQQNHKRETVEYKSASERLKSMERLVKTVVNQQKTLEDLSKRMEDTDAMILQYESRLHFQRVQNNGHNYVQNGYLETHSEDSMDEFLSQVNDENLEEYLTFCENIIKLEENLCNEEAKIEDISTQIQESYTYDDTASSSLNTSDDYVVLRTTDINSCDKTLDKQLEELRAELNRQLTSQMMKRFKMEDVAKEINYYDKILLQKNSTIVDIESELELLTNSERRTVRFAENNEYYSPSQNEHLMNKAYSPSEWEKLVRGDGCHTNSILKDQSLIRFQSKLIQSNSNHDRNTSALVYKPSNCQVLCDSAYKDDREDNDSNSDTGLSSMHSDDTPPTVLETLV